LVGLLALANIAPAAFEKPSAERLQLPQLGQPFFDVRSGAPPRGLWGRHPHLRTARLPLPDDAPEGHPKVEELRGLSAWSESQVWCSPERHGAMSGIIKVRGSAPTQGKTLAVMQVSGGSQSFNAVNQLRILGAGCG
jgi:hypothetical protein